MYRSRIILAIVAFTLTFSLAGCEAEEIGRQAGEAANQAEKSAKQAQKDAAKAKKAYDETRKQASKGSSSNSSSSTSAKTKGCKKPSSVQTVRFSRTKYPNIHDHWEQSIKKGWPEIYVINREGADKRRDRLLRDIPTKPGHDRDEQPAASLRGDNGKGTKGSKYSLEEGSNPTGWKASVEYVKSSENRSHGSSLGSQMRQWCDGTRLRFVFY